MPAEPKPFARREWLQLLIPLSLIACAVLLGITGYPSQGALLGLAAAILVGASSLGRRFLGVNNAHP